MPNKFAYLVGVSLFLPVWISLFLFRKDLRNKILIASSSAGIMAIFWSPWFLADYWKPNFLYQFSLYKWKLGGIEDFLYGFIVVGVACAIYEEVFGKRFAKRHNRKHHWSYLLIPFTGLFIFVFGLPVYLGVNSIYAAILSFLALTIYMLYFRKDLWIDALASGLIVGFLILLSYLIFLKLFPSVISQWWFLHNLSGVLIFGIPLEELLWAFGLGMVAGPLYEFENGIVLKDL